MESVDDRRQIKEAIYIKPQRPFLRRRGVEVTPTFAITPGSCDDLSQQDHEM